MIAVSFDFDGVLARSPFAYGVLFPALDGLAEIFSEGHGIEADAARSAVRDCVWAHFHARIGEKRYVEAYDWQQIVEEAAQELHLPFSDSLPELTQSYSDRLAATGDDTPAYPGAADILATLSNRGVHLIMLTNGYRAYQWPTAHALGLTRYFDEFYASDDIDTVKPFPEAFERAFAGSDETCLRKYHVGDSLTQDVAGARSAGIGAIWVHRELPSELAECSPLDRARHPGMREVIGAKFAREDQAAAKGDVEKCIPDAVVMSLEEIDQVVL